MTKNREMMNEKELTELAELFKVFGDSSRIKILYALFETEMGVGDIADTIDMTISVKDPEAESSGQEQKRRQVDLLFTG